MLDSDKICRNNNLPELQTPTPAAPSVLLGFATRWTMTMGAIFSSIHRIYLDLCAVISELSQTKNSFDSLLARISIVTPPVPNPSISYWQEDPPFPNLVIRTLLILNITNINDYLQSKIKPIIRRSIATWVGMGNFARCFLFIETGVSSHLPLGRRSFISRSGRLLQNLIYCRIAGEKRIFCDPTIRTGIENSCA